RAGDAQGYRGDADRTGVAADRPEERRRRHHGLRQVDRQEPDRGDPRGGRRYAIAPAPRHDVAPLYARPPAHRLCRREGGRRMTLPLALTMGEPAGIGGEIALQAWLRRAEGVSVFYVIDDPLRLATLAAQLGWQVPVQAIAAPKEALSAFTRSLPVLPLGGAPEAEPGRPHPADAAMVIAAIDMAIDDVQAGRASALV